MHSVSHDCSWEQPVQSAVVEVICAGITQGILWGHVIPAGFARPYNGPPCCMTSRIATESRLSAKACHSLMQNRTLILLILLMVFCRGQTSNRPTMEARGWRRGRACRACGTAKPNGYDEWAEPVPYIKAIRLAQCHPSLTHTDPLELGFLVCSWPFL